MPKILTDREKEMTMDAIYQKTVELIKEKGLRGVTVDDITRRANMAKGSFYKYYPTKEECLYEVIKRTEKEMFSKVKEILANTKPSKEIVAKALNEVYIGNNSIILYTTPNDFETLMRKLPEEYAKREAEKAVDYFGQTMYLLGIDGTKINLGILDNLMSSLAFLASKKNNQIENKEAMRLIVSTIAEYLTGGIYNE
ncbi:MAG: TetR/AcrR family transcriptional regulator [Oscillospiraceae bacterium]|nr:TetR/AcrR family transcriptional regulator [Oscillospiraceae bacterium]